MIFPGRSKRFFSCILLMLIASSSNAGETEGVLHRINRSYLSVPVSGVVSEVLVRVGQQVKKDQVMLRLDARRAEAHIQAAKARLARHKPGRDEAHRELKRAEELFERTVLSEVELQQAKIDFSEKDAALQEAYAEIIDATLNLEYGELKAPFDLVVLNVSVVTGQAVINRSFAAPLIEVAQNRLAVITHIAPEKLSGAKVGTGVTVSYGSKQIAGKVYSIDYDINKQRSTVRISLDEQSALRGLVGQQVNVTWP